MNNTKQTLHENILSLLESKDIYAYKESLYINKRWLRKIAYEYKLSFSLSDNTLSEHMYISTVRVTDIDGRYVEASASQRLTEDTLFDIEKAQSRATNRCIYDIYSLQELDLSQISNNLYSEVVAQEETTSSNTRERVRWEYKWITPKQKSYLKRLIEDGSDGWEYYEELINSIDNLSRSEAGKLIHEMLQEKETTTQ